jgi:palmitoyl-protein thioesterase
MSKEGLTKLNKMVLIGGPDDGVITPWQSSQFGYYDNNETIVEMHDRDEYKNDLIGLKTLDKQKKIIIHTVPGIPHFEWHKNASIVDQFILPYLD